MYAGFTTLVFGFLVFYGVISFPCFREKEHAAIAEESIPFAKEADSDAAKINSTDNIKAN